MSAKPKARVTASPAALMIGAALALLTGTAAAETANVSITGVIDTGIMVQHADGKTSATMESGNDTASGIDFRVYEPISEDLYARVYNYITVNSDTGTLYEDDVLFDGSALTLGSKTYGEITLGRYGALKSTDGDMSVFAHAQGFSPMGANIPGAGLAYTFTCDGMVNNAFGYTSPKINGWEFLAQYSNGKVQEKPVNMNDGRFASAAVVYNNDGNLRFGLILTHRTHGHTRVDAAGNSHTAEHKATNDVMVSMNYDFDAFRLYATYQHVENGLGPNTMLRYQHFGFTDSKKGFDTDSFMMGVRVPVAGGNLSTAFHVARSEFKGDNPQNLSTTGWRINPAMIYRYPLSKHTRLWTALTWSHGYGMYRNVKNAPADSPNATTWGAGLLHTF